MHAKVDALTDEDRGGKSESDQSGFGENTPFNINTRNIGRLLWISIPLHPTTVKVRSLHFLNALSGVNHTQHTRAGHVLTQV